MKGVTPSLGYAIWSKFNQDTVSVKVKEKMGRLARQAAHDLKSPLAALKMSVKSAEMPNADERLSISRSVNRVSDIVNVLNSATEFDVSNAVVGKGQGHRSLEKSHVKNVIAGIVSEKRVQYKNRHELEIIFEPLDSAYSVFLQTHPCAIRRVISNLIDNAVEAINGSGIVEIEMVPLGKEVEILVKDSGHGMSEEVQSQIFNEGFTTKTKGQGLGLHGVKTKIDELGGRIDVESSPGAGTTFKLRLAIAPPPKWFLDELVINEGAQIIALDDDDTVFDLWNEKLKGLSLRQNPIYMKSAAQVRRWCLGYPEVESLYLIDYELHGQGINGLELIEELKIKDKAILVTAHSDSSGIYDACIAKGIRMVPKECISMVPISVVSAKKPKNYHLRPEQPEILS